MTTRFASKVASGAALAMALGGAAHAADDQFSFSCVTGNTATQCAIGESQLFVTVKNVQGSLQFFFENTGPAPSSITAIYFDWNDKVYSNAPLTSAGTIADSGGGVAFTWDNVTPPELPGGASLAIKFNSDLAADSDSPVSKNGVNPGEWISFTWGSGNYTYANALADLLDGDLRIGMHVQAIGTTGGSESFVTLAPPVPEPGALALMLSGGLLVGAAVHRRRKG